MIIIIDVKNNTLTKLIGQVYFSLKYYSVIIFFI